MNPGFSIKAPTLSGNDMSFPMILLFIFTKPLVGKISPQIARISIVFPEPFLPTKP